MSNTFDRNVIAVSTEINGNKRHIVSLVNLVSGQIYGPCVIFNSVVHSQCTRPMFSLYFLAVCPYVYYTD